MTNVTTTHPTLKRKLATLALALFLVSGGVMVPRGEASAKTQRGALQFVLPKLSSDRGAPGKRGEGASRTCESENRLASLTALIPQYQATQAGQANQIIGQTTQAHPLFAFYIPIAAAEVASVDLTLLVLNDAGEVLYELPVEAPNQTGVVTVQIPESLPELALGQRYQWYLAMDYACSEGNSLATNLDYVSGWIERQALPSELSPDQLNQLDLAEQAQLYAQQGFWFDALAAVIAQRRADPSDEAATADWTQLLKSVNLEALAEAAILGPRCGGLLSPKTSSESR